MALAAIPYYLLALGLIFMVAFTWGLLPISGGYDIGTIPDVSVGFYAEAARHAVLPALSIILAQMGFWAIHMRGMMVTVLEEDYMILGEAKGLKGHRLFLRYAMRSAILPQATNLALTLGLILTQSVLVEVVFSYPGIGNVLFTAIRNLDYFLIYGIVFMMIVSVSLATLVIDLVYPLLDPRIRYAPA
jgi:peptide/nickel transport system permease protein